MQKILPVILSLGLASLSINAKATELTNLTELNLNTQLSLESKASAQGTDVTLVCFITDTSKCTGYEFGMNSKERCCAEGYCQDACEFPKVPTATCPYDSGYVSGCQCPSDYVKCLPGEIGIGPSCDGKYRECRSDACSGYRYAPSSSECPYGYTVDETPFGSACYHCRSCNRLPDETNCPYGTTIASDGCGGTRTVCAACTPKPDVDPARKFIGYQELKKLSGGPALKEYREARARRDSAKCRRRNGSCSRGDRSPTGSPSASGSSRRRSWPGHHGRHRRRLPLPPE